MDPSSSVSRHQWTSITNVILPQSTFGHVQELDRAEVEVWYPSKLGFDLFSSGFEFLFRPSSALIVQVSPVRDATLL